MLQLGLMHTVSQVHGVHLNPDEPTGFDLCVITRFTYIADSERQRLQVMHATAHANVGLIRFSFVSR